MSSRLLVSAPPIFPGNNRTLIDENSFKRHHTVLCYKELSEAHTFDVLADTMQQFHRAFDIESKIILAINILFCVLFSLFFLCVYPISMLCDRGHIRNVFIFSNVMLFCNGNFTCYYK